MDLSLVFQKLALALGLGLLVGLQRQKVQSELAGIRTFTFITLLGTIAGLLSQTFGGWIVAAGLVGVAAMMVVGNVVRRIRPGATGMTTEVAALLMYGIGAYLVVGHEAAALATGGVVAVLLHLKAPMHRFVARIGQDDLRAVMQLVLIGLVILPVLPDKAYDPYGVLNPYEIWLMVVLIVGISLSGYVAARLFGAQAGTLLAGVLGGMISSTATTASYARRTRRAPTAAGLVAIVILTASCTSLVRVMVEIGAVARPHFLVMSLPLMFLLGGSVLLTLGVWLFVRRQPATLETEGTPAELKTALVFGATYAGVLFLVALAKEYAGARGLYLVAVLSGLQDLDAITLSTARMVQQDKIAGALGCRLVLSAALSNLVFKGALALVLGHAELRKWIAILFGAMLALGLTILFFWPA